MLFYLKSSIYLILIALLIITAFLHVLVKYQNKSQNDYYIWDILTKRPESWGKLYPYSTFSEEETQFRAKSLNDHVMVKHTLSSSSTISDIAKKGQKDLVIQSSEQKKLNPASGNTPSDFAVDWSQRLKESFSSGMNVVLPQTSIALMFSLLFGGDKQLSPDLRQELKTIGMQHIVSASGYNVNLLLSLFNIDGMSGGKWWKLGGFSLLLFLFLFFVGFTPSVVRAAVMTLLQLIGRHCCGRQLNTVYILLSAGALMVLIHPQYLLSISFQLSMSATLGIACFAKGWTQNWSFIRNPLFVGAIETGILTTAAQVFTLPFLWYYFSEWSLISLPANIFLLWLIVPLTGMGLLIIVTNLFCPFLLPAWIFVWTPLYFLFEWGVGFFSQFSFFLLHFSGHQKGMLFLAWTGIVCTLLFSRFRARKRVFNLY